VDEDKGEQHGESKDESGEALMIAALMASSTQLIWQKNHLHVVVFVQGATSRHILGVASLARSQTAATNSNEARGLK